MAQTGRSAQLIRLRLGRFSAMCMLLAALGIVDALSTLMQRDFNRFDLLPGEVEQVTGPMPPDTTEIEELRIYVKSDAVKMKDDVKLVPEEIYKGFWFGGQMWKGRLEASPAAQPGEYRLAVINENEDPALINDSQISSKTHPSLSYKLVIWANAIERQKASDSILIRYLDTGPFIFAAFFAFCGILIGVISWWWTEKTYRILASEGRSTIHMVRKMPEGGTEIAFYVERFSSNVCRPFENGHHITILDSNWKKKGEAKVTNCENKLVNAVLTASSPGDKPAKQPDYGDIVEY